MENIDTILGLEESRPDEISTDLERSLVGLDEALTPATLSAAILEVCHLFTRRSLETEAGSRARAWLETWQGSIRCLDEDPPDFGRFEFGHYPCRDRVREALTVFGFSAAEIETSGLVADDRWEGRLVHPIRDRTGQIVSFFALDPGVFPVEQIGAGRVDSSYSAAPDFAGILLLPGPARGLFGLDRVQGPLGPIDGQPWGLSVLLVQGIWDCLNITATLSGDAEEPPVALGAPKISMAQIEALEAAGVGQVKFLPRGGQTSSEALVLVDAFASSPIRVSVVDPIAFECQGGEGIGYTPGDAIIREGAREFCQKIKSRLVHPALGFRARQLCRAFCENYWARGPEEGPGPEEVQTMVDEALSFEASITDTGLFEVLDREFWPRIWEYVREYFGGFHAGELFDQTRVRVLSGRTLKRAKYGLSGEDRFWLDHECTEVGWLRKVTREAA